MTSVGILGIGTHLPPAIRTNDWWPRAVVADWEGRMASRLTTPDEPDMPLGEGVRRTLAAMQEYMTDPFRGAVERRVMADGMTAHQMEAAAARQALDRAGIRADQVDVILEQTPAPENLVVNHACVTHELLELPRRCLAIATDSACNAFAHHIELARALIESGRARHVLSVHSCAMTRMMRPNEPDSAWWGDGAAAVVLGAVADGKGVLGTTQYTDGSTRDALVLGVPGKRWWQDGEITLHALDRDHTRKMMMSLVERARDTVADCLTVAGVTARDVGFYAAHQGTAWLSRVTAEHAGLAHAKTIATFPAFANLSSVNIPLILSIAESEGMICDGMVVVTFSGGVGETWSSVCLRWGR